MKTNVTLTAWLSVVIESLCKRGWTHENARCAVADYGYLFDMGVSGISSARTIFLNTIQSGKWVSVYGADAPYVAKSYLENVS